MNSYLDDLALAVINSFESGTIVTDMDGNIVLINASAKRILNLPLLQTDKPNIYKHEKLSSFAHLLNEIIEKGESISRREIPFHSDGDEKTLGVTTSPIRRGKQIFGVVFLFTDLTQIKKLQYEAEINRQLAHIGELTASIVHELKNPITVIMGTLEILQQKTKDKDPYIYQKLQLIHNEVHFLEILVSQFLQYSKPQDVHIHKEDTDYIIQEAIHFCSYLISKYSVNVEIKDIPPHLRIIHADGPRLAQAIANLIRNAIEVQIDNPNKWIGISIEERDEHIIFRIEDAGPGLPANVPKRELFKPFFSQKKKGGTGLGLSIVEKIVSAHHGWVDCSPREPHGAIFEIGIPITPKE